MVEQSFWHEGNIVKLREPFKPISPTNTLYSVVVLAQSTSMVNDTHLQGRGQWERWGGFTHGIIAEVYAHKTGGEASNVSLFLYDPERCVINIAQNGIPQYEDFPVEDLIP